MSEKCSRKDCDEEAIGELVVELTHVSRLDYEEEAIRIPLCEGHQRILPGTFVLADDTT